MLAGKITVDDVERAAGKDHRSSAVSFPQRWLPLTVALVMAILIITARAEDIRSPNRDHETFRDLAPPSVACPDQQTLDEVEALRRLGNRFGEAIVLPSALRWQNDTEYNALVGTHLSRSADVSAPIGRDHVVDLIVGHRRACTVHFNFVVVANHTTLGMPQILLK